MDVLGVRVEMPTNQPIVLLRERGSDRHLPIWIGAAEASAIAFAPDVRFSIRDEDADSDRSSTEADGATSEPSSPSNRAISAEASSASAATGADRFRSASAIAGTTADRYGPAC